MFMAAITLCLSGKVKETQVGASVAWDAQIK